MQISTDSIARQPVRLMDEPTCSDEIYTVDYLYRIYILITYENQKNKNTRNIAKNRCLVAYVTFDAHSN